jgi:molecular chaperone DnaK (HSP70)
VAAAAKRRPGKRNDAHPSIHPLIAAALLPLPNRPPNPQITRAQFEKLCSDLLDRCKRPVEQALRDAKLSINGAPFLGGGVASESVCAS